MITFFFSSVVKVNSQGLWSLRAPLGAIFVHKNGRREYESQEVRLCLAGMTFMRNVRGRKTDSNFICGA